MTSHVLSMYVMAVMGLVQATSSRLPLQLPCVSPGSSVQASKISLFSLEDLPSALICHALPCPKGQAL
ncbi:hypothetical protein DSO57_1007547 [Entomophthora muscae]|uniref:Uncharacterized protein n=1 Tax=Entomophthora muscae TaxID=34485 RepID=A0ACC2RM62_9FUNG|nr:hypothetical protein DSO57_1007547 [Entomophthora muscae]